MGGKNKLFFFKFHINIAMLRNSTLNGGKTLNIFSDRYEENLKTSFLTEVQVQNQSHRTTLSQRQKSIKPICHAGGFKNHLPKDFLIQELFQTFYSPTNAHVEFIKTH